MRLPRRRLRTPRRLPEQAVPPAPARPAGADARSQESTVLAAVPEEISGVPAPEPPPRATPPRPPLKIAFDCLCGANLVATPATYDQRSRCSVCQTLLLLSLVYDADCRSFEIVPFKIDPSAGS